MFMCGNDNMHFFSLNKKKWILVHLYQMNPKCLLLFCVNDISNNISKNISKHGCYNLWKN